MQSRSNPNIEAVVHKLVQELGNKRTIMVNFSSYWLVRFIDGIVLTLILTGKAAAFEGEVRLEDMRPLQLNASVSQFEKLSPAKNITLAAPKNADVMNTPYRNREGCVIFFYVPAKNVHDLSFTWSGAAVMGNRFPAPACFPCNTKKIGRMALIPGRSSCVENLLTAA